MRSVFSQTIAKGSGSRQRSLYALRQAAIALYFEVTIERVRRSGQLHPVLKRSPCH
ncbi:MAG: hypothetical protein ACFB12_25355 [Leptolyngbyaceae cyanobacterium]